MIWPEGIICGGVALRGSSSNEPQQGEPRESAQSNPTNGPVFQYYSSHPSQRAMEAPFLSTFRKVLERRETVRRSTRAQLMQPITRTRQVEVQFTFASEAIPAEP
jgi:hypothetical protein